MGGASPPIEGVVFTTRPLLPSMLDRLPTEILLHVFSFLPARTLIHCLVLVCRKFYELLGEEWVWRKRFLRQCGGTPLVLMLEDSSLRRLQQACVQADVFALIRDHRQGDMKTVFLPGIDGGLARLDLLIIFVLLPQLVVVGLTVSTS